MYIAIGYQRRREEGGGRGRGRLGKHYSLTCVVVVEMW